MCQQIALRSIRPSCESERRRPLDAPFPIWRYIFCYILKPLQCTVAHGYLSHTPDFLAPAVLLRYYARRLTAPQKLRAFSRQARENQRGGLLMGFARALPILRTIFWGLSPAA